MDKEDHRLCKGSGGKNQGDVFCLGEKKTVHSGKIFKNNYPTHLNNHKNIPCSLIKALF